MLSLEKSYQNDFSDLLPVFIYHDANQVSSITLDMDRAISKAMKVISDHSITTKPEYNEEKELSEKERAFYSQNEYNKWVDDAYLLMGKSHFHKHEFEQASQTFQFIIGNFDESNNTIESRIWLARLAIHSNRQKEASEILTSLEKETELSKGNKYRLFSTIAELAILNNDYEKAIINLKKSIVLGRSKYYKQRYTYLIAQLYQKLNRPANATEYYKKVIKLNPPYEMTFSARVNLALSFDSGTGSRREIEKQLEKMLRDDKNIDFQDQIYYAWGNIYFKSGNTDKAIEYYKKSASTSKDNTSQIVRTYLTIADIYYDKPEYIPAQSYYDSAVRKMDESYPDYQQIFNKSTSLTRLVQNIQTVELEDSVLVLASLPSVQLNTVIDNIIAAEKEKEETARQIENQRNVELAESRQQQFMLQNNSGNSWYFYNPTAVSLGRDDFKKRWGNRKLEDNWRRLNKSTSSVESDFASGTENISSEEVTEGNAAVFSNKYSREYYLKDIPFTEEAKANSVNRIEKALFSIGEIYFNDLNDYTKAEVACKDYISRFPSGQNVIEVYYRLYTIGKNSENNSLMTAYQQKIINEFPESNYAKVLTDPDYYKKIEDDNKKVSDLYEQVYKVFNEGNYSNSASLARKAMADNPNHELFQKFDYIATVSEGLGKDSLLFVEDLKELKKRYPQAEFNANIDLIINYLSETQPSLIIKSEIKEAESYYTLKKESPHFAVISIKQGANSNQMMFNIISFNIEKFEDADLKVLRTNLANKLVFAVTTFAHAEAALDYLNQINNYTDLWRDVEKIDSELFIISQDNYDKLKQQEQIDKYLLFYRANY